MDPNRKCYRMVGGVLVERNVGEVLPAVQSNKNGVCVVISEELLEFIYISYVMMLSSFLDW